MAERLRFLIFLCFFTFVVSKELHKKQETLEAKDKDDKVYINLFNDQDTADNKNERYARHVKAVTESALDHILNEIKQYYMSPTYNPNSPIPRLMKNLNKELKRNEQNKLHREKDKKKISSKKKNSNRNTNKRKIKITTKMT